MGFSNSSEAPAVNNDARNANASVDNRSDTNFPIDPLRITFSHFSIAAVVGFVRPELKIQVPVGASGKKSHNPNHAAQRKLN